MLWLADFFFHSVESNVSKRHRYENQAGKQTPALQLVHKKVQEAVATIEPEPTKKENHRAISFALKKHKEEVIYSSPVSQVHTARPTHTKEELAALLEAGLKETGYAVGQIVQNKWGVNVKITRFFDPEKEADNVTYFNGHPSLIWAQAVNTHAVSSASQRYTFEELAPGEWTDS